MVCVLKHCVIRFQSWTCSPTFNLNSEIVKPLEKWYICDPFSLAKINFLFSLIFVVNELVSILRFLQTHLERWRIWWCCWVIKKKRDLFPILWECSFFFVAKESFYRISLNLLPLNEMLELLCTNFKADIFIAILVCNSHTAITVWVDVMRDFNFDCLFKVIIDFRECFYLFVRKFFLSHYCKIIE